MSEQLPAIKEIIDYLEWTKAHLNNEDVFLARRTLQTAMALMQELENLVLGLQPPKRD